MKNKIVVMLIILSYGLTACGSSTSEKEESISEQAETYIQEDSKDEIIEFDLEEYKKSAQDLRSSMYTAALMLNNMTNYEVAHLQVSEKINSNIDSTELVQKAFDHIEKQEWDTRENIEASDSSIRKAYKEFILIEFSDNKEASEIETELKSFYDAYAELYSLANSPSGSASSFESAVNKAINTMVSSNNALDLWLDAVDKQ